MVPQFFFLPCLRSYGHSRRVLVLAGCMFSGRQRIAALCGAAAGGQFWGRRRDPADRRSGRRPACFLVPFGGPPSLGGAVAGRVVFFSARLRPPPRAELQSGLQVMFPGVIAVTRVQNIVGSVMTITSSYFHLHLRALPGSGGGIGRLPSPKDIMFAAGPIH